MRRNQTKRLLALVAVLLSTACAEPVKHEASAIRNCPDWSSNPVHNYNNDDFSNLGCASDANLQAQVQDPQDLKQGKGKQGMTAARESSILQGYWSGSSVTPGGGTASGGSVGR